MESHNSEPQYISLSITESTVVRQFPFDLPEVPFWREIPWVSIDGKRTKEIRIDQINDVHLMNIGRMLYRLYTEICHLGQARGNYDESVKSDFSFFKSDRAQPVDGVDPFIASHPLNKVQWMTRTFNSISEGIRTYLVWIAYEVMYRELGPYIGNASLRFNIKAKVTTSDLDQDGKLKPGSYEAVIDQATFESTFPSAVRLSQKDEILRQVLGLGGEYVSGEDDRQ